MRFHANLASIFFMMLCLSMAFLATAGAQPESETSRSQLEAAPEFRGLWITRFVWPSSDGEETRRNIVEVFEDMAADNFNAAFFQVRGAAETLYPSELEPWSRLIGGSDPGFDPMALAIEEAHRRGIEFHAYINAFPLFVARDGLRPTDENHLFHRHGPNAEDSWVTRDPEGKPAESEYYYMAPGIPEVQSYVRRAIMDVVRRYDVDGIHLDRIRYPGPQYSHDPISRRRFLGRGNPNRLEWADWQREQIDKFVNDLKAEIAAEKSYVVLSASVWGIYNRYHIEGYYGFSSGYHDYYQDSYEWLRLGAMDYLVPMIYWDMGGRKPDYDELLRDFAENLPIERIIGGQHTYRDMMENVKQIRVTRELGAAGTTIFAYQPRRDDGRFPVIRRNVYARPAPLPARPWVVSPEDGIVLGTVIDESGQPVVDAWVSLESASGEGSRARAFRQVWPSGADGRFAFLEVPPGAVRVEVEYPGAGTVTSDPIDIVAGEVAEVEIAVAGAAEASREPFLDVLGPEDGAETTVEVVHLIGRTQPGAKVSVVLPEAAGGEESERTVEPEVLPTGVFVHDNIPLAYGRNALRVVADLADGVTTGTAERILDIERVPPVSRSGRTGLDIQEPDADLALMAGDILTVRAAAAAGLGGEAQLGNDGPVFPLAELRGSQEDDRATYEGAFRIPSGMAGQPRPVHLHLAGRDDFGSSVTLRAESKNTVEIWAEAEVRVARTTGERTAITHGLHGVRLGGPFLSELPEGVHLTVTGRRGGSYRVRLSESNSGWVDADDVEFLPEGTKPAKAYFTYFNVGGDEETGRDTISIPLSDPVPFAISAETDPNRVLLDIFGTHHAATWEQMRATSKVIGRVATSQLEDGWVRVTVPVESKQNWGFWIERSSSSLQLHVKHPPEYGGESGPLSGLKIAIEAGHGGGNTGAQGFMGELEKTINAAAARATEAELRARGADVVQVRPGDAYLPLWERVDAAIEADADFFLSIHANSASTARGYLRVSGTSTYFKHPPSYLAAKLVYNELLKLGWEEFGIVGNFNYTPLRTTHMPAILVEQAFMSNPSDVARLSDSEYQRQQAVAIADGLEKFFAEVKE